MPESFDLELLHLPQDSEVRELICVCSDAELVRFGDGELLVAPGDPGKDIFLVLRGSCLIEHADAPEERTHGHELAVIEGTPAAPVFVGEMAYLGGGHRSAVVRSALNVFALRLKPVHIDAIIDRFPSFTRILCRQFCRRLAEADELLRCEQSKTAMQARQVSYEAGQTVFEKGQPAHEAYQVVFGVVIEERDGEAPREWGYADAEPVFLGAREFLTGGVYASTVRAKSAAMLLAIEEASRRALIRNYPDVALRLLSGEG